MLLPLPLCGGWVKLLHPGLPRSCLDPPACEVSIRASAASPTHMSLRTYLRHLYHSSGGHAHLTTFATGPFHTTRRLLYVGDLNRKSAKDLLLRFDHRKAAVSFRFRLVARSHQHDQPLRRPHIPRHRILGCPGRRRRRHRRSRSSIARGAIVGRAASPASASSTTTVVASVPANASCIDASGLLVAGTMGAAPADTETPTEGISAVRERGAVGDSRKVV